MAYVWVASSTFTFSFASMAWCSPSEYLLPSSTRPVCSSTIFTLPSTIIYSVSFSNKVYAFSNWLTLWIRCDLVEYSLIRFSFLDNRSSALSTASFSILLSSVPISGIIKNFGSSPAPVIRSIPFSVRSTLLSFSSITKKRGWSASGIIFLLSCK